MKKRLLLIPLVALFAAIAPAQMRMHPSAPPADPSGMMGSGIMNGAMAGAMVSGKVDSFAGTDIYLAGGKVIIDASSATFIADGAKSTIASIHRDDFVVATLKTTDVSTDARLAATIVAVIRQAAVTLVGEIQDVGHPAGTLKILGKTVSTDANTSFGGMFGQKTLADVPVGSDAMVSANVVGGNLVATNVLVMGTQMSQPPMGGNHTNAKLLRGVVKSIGASTWVITVGTSDATVLVNAQTRIVGDPKAGDKVDVMATVDSANTYTALAIFKSLF